MILSDINNKSAIRLALLFFIVYYVLWLFPFGRVVQVHDNLDVEVVLNYIIAQIISGSEISTHLALNGALPPFAFSRLFQPLTLLYTIFDPWTAYAVSDILVRLIGFLGLYLVSNHIGLRPIKSILFGLAFATSISYTVFLFSVAGIPLVLWLLLKSSYSRSYKLLFIWFSIFFIGTNISFALSGFFLLLLVIPIVVYGFEENLNANIWIGFILLAIGIFLGNSNIFYSQFLSNITWHRVEWGVIRASDYSLFPDVLKVALKAFWGSSWYHSSYALQIINIGVVVLLFLNKGFRDRKIIFLLLLSLSFYIIYIFSQTSLSDPLKDLIPFFAYFQWDRFYFLYSSVIFVALIFISKSVDSIQHKSLWLSRLVFLILIFQIISNIIQSPVPQYFINTMQGKVGDPTFDGYYRRKDYEFIKRIIGNDAVLSLGVDPMIAPMNGIPSIDGYYVLYPLKYKNEFREVIEFSMVAAGRKDYFDKWGSRIYAFYKKGHPEMINFCAAHKLGAKYVISIEEITSQFLHRVAGGELRNDLYLYRIISLGC